MARLPESASNLDFGLLVPGLPDIPLEADPDAAGRARRNSRTQASTA